MHIPSSLSCVLLALAPLAAPQDDHGRDSQPANASDRKLEHFTYEQAEMEAPSTKMGVYLPKGYADAANSEKRYPWAVWLHGRGESHRKFYVDGGAQALDTLRGKDEIPELIFVALTLSNPVYVDGAGGGDQEKLITEQLPAFLAKKYRVETDRTKRALMGVSMGGFGALKIALRHPDLFGTVAAHSSALMPANPSDLPDQYQRTVQRMLERGGLDKVFGNPIDTKKWAEHMPMALAADMEVDKLKTLQIYFDAGSDDRYGFAPPNKAMDDLLTKRGVPHEFELVEGGGHSWGSGSLQKQLVKSLRFVGASLRGAKTDAKASPAKEATPEAAGAGKR